MGDFSKKNTVYGTVTDQFIQKLREGRIPWRSRFKIDGFPHMNLLTKHPYNGINQFVTASGDYNSPFWVSRRQSFDLGMTVKPDENYSAIVYFTMLEKKDDPGKMIPFARFSQCFNLSQMASIPDGVVPTIPKKTNVNPSAEQLLEKMKVFLPRTEVGAKTIYARTDDVIYIMNQEHYADRNDFYTDLFKQCIISTIHQSRLDFSKVNPTELELMGELGSAFLCQECDIQFLVDDSASYIANWISKLVNDASVIVNASKKAYKAIEFLLKVHNEEAEKDYKKLLIDNTLRNI